jgi:O-antigen/teichoic acid export membrane protein
MTSSSKEVGRFFRHSSIYAVGNALNRVGAFLLLPIYTRLLSPAEYGAIETLYLVSSVVSGILGVGIAHATLRFYFDYSEPGDRKAVISTNLTASLAISTAGVLVISLFSGVISDRMFEGLNIGSAFLWMLASVVFELASQVSLAYVRAVERSVLFIVVSLVKLLVQVVANTVALLYFHAGVEGVMAGNCITVAVGFVVLTVVTLRDCGMAFQWAKLMPVLRYSLPFLWTAMVGIVSSTADRFLLQTFVSLEALGIYALALKFAKLISDLIGEPVNRAYGAFRFTIMERSDAGAIQAQVVRYLAVVLTLASLGVVLFTADVLRMMAAPAYWSASKYMAPLALASLLQVLVYPLQTGIYYRKQSSQIFYVAVAQSVVGAGLGALLIWVWGIWGACLTVLAVAVAGIVLTDRISQRYFAVQYEKRKLATLFALALAVCAGGYVLDLMNTPWAVPAKLGLTLAFVAALIFTRVVEPHEAELCRAWLARRFGRKPASAA